MHSVRLEPTELVMIGTRTTYQATGDAGLYTHETNAKKGMKKTSTTKSYEENSLKLRYARDQTGLSYHNIEQNTWRLANN